MHAHLKSIFQARIPGSILHNYEEGIGDMGKMIKDVEMLKQDFEKLGITKDKQISMLLSLWNSSRTYLFATKTSRFC